VECTIVQILDTLGLPSAALFFVVLVWIFLNHDLKIRELAARESNE